MSSGAAITCAPTASNGVSVTAAPAAPTAATIASAPTTKNTASVATTAQPNNNNPRYHCSYVQPVLESFPCSFSPPDYDSDEGS